MRRMIAITLLAACGTRAADLEHSQAPTATTDGPATVEWRVVEAELAAHICLRTFDTPMGKIEEPIFGPRKNCERPPATTALERAVERAWVDADPILSAMRHAWKEPVLAAHQSSDPASRLPAVRDAYLSERFRGLLLAHLEPALADENLRCIDCPPPFEPPPRTVQWDELAAYVALYTWPDPVETPATGEPRYGMHICIGTNGIGELSAPDPALVELGFLTTFHNDPLRERASAVFASLRTDPGFARLTNDFMRTRWLRARLGRALLAESAVREGVCAAAKRFQPDTGITVVGC